MVTAQSTFGGRVTQAAVDGIYAKGTQITLTAVADSGYEFLGWSEAASGSTNPLTLTLDASKTVRAEFRRTGVASYSVALTVSGPGTARRVPDLGAYESGTEVELVAEPTAGALFGGWSGAVTSSQRRVRVTVNGAVSVAANFKSVYPVATETRGEGQVLLSPPDASYADGSPVALTAKPAEGWGFVQWSGDLTTTTQESALTVDAPKRVVAEFARLGTLTLKSIGQGAIAKTPDAASYLPGTAVSLKATPAAGWKFVRWSGGASGSNAELAVVVGRTEAIVAEFGDGEAPKLALTEPVSGSVSDERFALKGSVFDNLRLASVTWTWNAVSQGAVPMSDGVFSIDGLTLNPGTNQIVMEALDASGNSTRVERVVVWTPVRSLVVNPAVEVQEGRRLVFPVTIDSPGDVAGLTFQLAYDPVWLTDPQWEWGALVGQSVNTLNTATNGQVWATFSMPGQALPLGVQAVATLSFRARSVPEVREVDLKSSIRSVSGLQGNALSLGNAAISGKGRIKPRRLKADNNANQRLDIGDAVVVARLQVGLEETRVWDVGLNDLNSSGSLDNGDVVKVLRTVVGLDPQPSPGSEGKRLGSALGLAKVLVNTNDVMAIDLIEGPSVIVGQPYRVAIRLNRVKGSFSGLSFTFKYPASLSLTDKQAGALVPSDAVPLWYESSGQVSFAAISSTAWANSTGVAAVLTFVPNASFIGQSEWPLKLEQAEITSGGGFDLRPVDSVTMAIALKNDSPQATAIPAQNGVDAAQLNVNAGANFSDPNGDKLAFSVTGLPQGVSIDPATGIISGTLDKSASVGGPYSVIVTAKDPSGASISATFALAVTNPAPMAVNDVGTTAYLTPVTAKVSANDTDADGDTLTFIASTDPKNGAVTFAADGTYTYTPAKGFSGTDSFIYQVKDADNATATAMVSITVENAGPQVTAIAAQNGVDATQFNINVGVNFSDPNGDKLTFSATGLPNGMSIDPATGIISGTLDKSASVGGPYSVIVTAEDPISASMSATFALAVTNPAPVAVNDVTTTAYMTPVTAKVGVNDTDADGDLLTFSKVSDPENGKVTFAADGTYTYTPAEGFSGTVSFIYQVRDADNETAMATVTLTVEGGGTVNTTPQLTLQPPAVDGSLMLEIHALQGTIMALEASSDLSTWTETQRITGQGNASPVKITLQLDPNVQTKFWRVRIR